MAPFRKGGMFQMFSGSDYSEAKKRLNIRNYRLILNWRDFNFYDTKFFGALLPILNQKRPEFQLEKGQIPVPKTLNDVIKQEFFTVSEKKKKS
jgi:hypothetical protein